MPDPPYDPCHIWQDAVEQGVLLLEQGTELIQGNMPQLIQCRMDNPGSGPQPQPGPPQPLQQQPGMRQISESQVIGETDDQRTVRLAVQAIRTELHKIRAITH